MPTRGGSSGATGYDYQFWFIAYQISRLILFENLIIHPEVKIIQEPKFNSDGQILGTIPKINYVDDYCRKKSEINKNPCR